MSIQASVNPDQYLDPIWRINNLYTITDKHSRRVPFRPWDEQQEFLTNFHTRNLILKCRQRGMTTLMCIVQLDDCIFTPNIRAAVIAHKLDDAKIIFRDKVKFVYDQLDDAIKDTVSIEQDSADTLSLSNNSAFRVSTSARSGTLNWLHISEYGKICAIFPEKAREIRTGSFPATENGIITIESTAEGNSGDFFTKSQDAEEILLRGEVPGPKDFKFFFFPWWRAEEYTLPQSTAPTSPEDEIYFDRVELEIGRPIDQGKRNWWLAQERDLGGDMKREYPATPTEAFEQALEGAIFADQIATAYKHERIGNYPVDPSRGVSTFWDIGQADETAIWLAQDYNAETRFVGYYENSGEGIEFFLRWLKDWAEEHNATWNKHYLPHDGDKKTFWTPEGSMALMSNLGFNPEIVSRTPRKFDAIQIARRKFQMAVFDESACKKGIDNLKKYRKEWDEKRGVWRDYPYHGPESNGADAFMTWAQSDHRPIPAHNRRRKRYRDRQPTTGATSWMSM